MPRYYARWNVVHDLAFSDRIVETHAQQKELEENLSRALEGTPDSATEAKEALVRIPMGGTPWRPVSDDLQAPGNFLRCSLTLISIALRLPPYRT